MEETKIVRRRKPGICQLQTVPEFAEPLSLLEIIWQLKNRARRVFKRRFRFAVNALTREEPAAEALAVPVTLKPGDLVRVKSEKEVMATLDNWNQLHRCAWMEEMAPYCGTTQKILKRVEKFLDERDYRMKKCKKIVILEGVWCPGTVDFGECDRCCHFFWREEWLEKVESPTVP